MAYQMTTKTWEAAMVALNTAGITFEIGSNRSLWVGEGYETCLQTPKAVLDYIKEVRSESEK